MKKFLFTLVFGLAFGLSVNGQAYWNPLDLQVRKDDPTVEHNR